MRLAINQAARVDARFRLAARSAEMARERLLSGEERQYELLEQLAASDPMIDGAKLIFPPDMIQVLLADGKVVRQPLGLDHSPREVEGWNHLAFSVALRGRGRDAVFFCAVPHRTFHARQ